MCFWNLDMGTVALTRLASAQAASSSPRKNRIPVGYLPLLVFRVLPLRVLAAITTIRALARTQVLPLDVALVDQVTSPSLP